MTLFKLYPLIQALIIVLFFIRPIRSSLKTKLIISAILLIGTFKLYVFIFTGGNAMDPKLSRISTMFLSCLYFSSLMVLMLTLGRMVLNGLYKALRRNLSKFIINPHSLRYAILSVVLSLVLGTVSVYNGFKAAAFCNYSVNIDSLSPLADGMRIIHLSDLHISAPTTEDEIKDIVKEVNSRNAEVIVITGDLVDGDVEDLKKKTDLLFKLKAKYGVYAVSGNHEFYSGYDSWIDYFNKGGIIFLENDSVTIHDNDYPLLNICGITDATAHKYSDKKADIPSAIKNINADAPVIFLTHQPKVADELSAISDLTLAGHTHGGLFPVLKSLVAVANNGYVSGFYTIGKEKMIVSNGTRIWAGIPLRLKTPSQIIEITLKRTNSF